MAVALVASARRVDGVEVVAKRAQDAGVQDILAADALVIGCSENFGGMSGMVKDLLERIYYPCQGKLEGRAWSHFVCCGSDGSGAVLGLERVAKGLGLRKVHPGVVWRGGRPDVAQTVPPPVLAECELLGATLGEGLAAGLW